MSVPVIRDSSGRIVNERLRQIQQRAEELYGPERERERLESAVGAALNAVGQFLSAPVYGCMREKREFSAQERDAILTQLDAGHLPEDLDIAKYQIAVLHDYIVDLLARDEYDY